MNNDNESTKVTSTRDKVLFPNNINEMISMANTLVKSGFCPKGVTTGAQALAILLAGREIQLPPMQALRNMYVVNGKVSLTTALMAALTRRAGFHYIVVERNTEICTIDFYRDAEPYRQTYSIEDAERAQLISGVNWKKYPAEMLYARCFATGARIVYPDILAGYYTPEELGVVVDADGEIIDYHADEQLESGAPERISMMAELKTLLPEKTDRARCWQIYREECGIDAGRPGELDNDSYQRFLEFCKVGIEPAEASDVLEYNDSEVTHDAD